MPEKRGGTTASGGRAMGMGAAVADLQPLMNDVDASDSDRSNAIDGSFSQCWAVSCHDSNPASDQAVLNRAEARNSAEKEPTDVRLVAEPERPPTRCDGRHARSRLGAKPPTDPRARCVANLDAASISTTYTLHRCTQYQHMPACYLQRGEVRPTRSTRLQLALNRATTRVTFVDRVISSSIIRQRTRLRSSRQHGLVRVSKFARDRHWRHCLGGVAHKVLGA